MNIYETNKKAYTDLSEMDDIKQNKTDQINQAGGGAWSCYSDGNDYTQDLISQLKLREYKEKEIGKNKDGTTIYESEITYHRDINTTNKALKKLFNMYKSDVIRHNKKHKTCDNKCNHDDKHIDYCWGYLNYAYFGVIIDLLLNEYPIHVKYLERALIHAYKNYININVLKCFTGWRSWEERKKCLIDEIHLINIAINTSRRKVGLLKIPENKNSKEPRIKTFLKSISKNKNSSNKMMDHIHFKRETISGQYYWENNTVVPCVDPNLLRIGTVMGGYNKRKANHGRKSDKININGFIVEEKNNNHIWSRYDTNGILVLDEQIWIDLYGEEYEKLMKV